MTADAQEKWLEQNTIRCKRFELRISPAVCQRYQAEWPLRCQGCEIASGVAQEAAPTPQERGGRASKGRHGARHGASPYSTHYQAKEPAEMAKVAVCACGCGKKGTILARGLLASCYEKVRREGNRDKFPTNKAPAEPAVDKALAAENDRPPVPVEAAPSAGSVIVRGDQISAADVAEMSEVPALIASHGHNVVTCRCGCGAVGRMHGRGLVKQCYDRLKRSGRLQDFPPRIDSHRAPGSPERPKSGKAVHVTIIFDPDRDGALYHHLVESAHADRRPIYMQILAILDDYFADQAI